MPPGTPGEFWAKATGTNATALTTNAINAVTLKSNFMAAVTVSKTVVD
jgi:hypothetical protein